jgi:hypothetical protein
VVHEDIQDIHLDGLNLQQEQTNKFVVGCT